MKKFFTNRLFTFSVAVIIAAGVFGGGFYSGYQRGVQNPKEIIIRGVTNLEEDNNESVDFNLFWEAWDLIKNKYLKSKETDNQNLVYGAISGLVDSLGDPNSMFLPPEESNKFYEDITGEFGGIGAQIGIKNEQLVVIAPLKDNPAEKAGLRPGDNILKINDLDTTGISTEEAVMAIRGEVGTTVTLTIFREGWGKSREFSIVRDTIQVPTIDWEMRSLNSTEGGDNIAYVQLYNFSENASILFYKTAIEVFLKRPKGLILDLRSNPGGYLDVAVNLAGWFLEPNKLVAAEEFSSGEKQEFKSYGSGLFKNLPMVIIVDEGSASAAEILAGAIRDARGIKIVGKQSFGKGTVQELQPLKDGSTLKITVAHWLLPSGQLIEGNGLTPDYKVDLTEKDIEEGKDPQLEKAMEVLRSEIE